MLNLATGSLVDNFESLAFLTNWILVEWTSGLIAFARILSAAVVFTIVDRCTDLSDFAGWDWLDWARLQDAWWTLLSWDTIVNWAAHVS